MDDIIVLDTNLEPVDILDVYNSIIWTERYSAAGDFEVFTPMSIAAYSLLQPDHYLKLKSSNNLMIIEGRRIASDSEQGDQLVVTGRSLESILDRRIVWDQTIMTGDFQTNMLVMLLDNEIDAADTARNIPNFDYVASDNSYILGLEIEKQVHGELIYDVIKDACDAANLGFRIHLNSSKQFIFEFYYGVDRSFDQLLNPWVVFSSKYENIINSNYIYNKMPYKTVSLVLGAGEGSARKGVSISRNSDTGLYRREMYTDASSLAEEEDGVPIPEIDYLAQLTQKGAEELVKNDVLDVFEGEVETVGSFIFKKDFDLGDLVQIEDKYGNSGKARVTEIIRSSSPTGSIIYPTFKTVE